LYIYAASGIVTLCRCLSCAPVKKELWSSFLKGAQDSHLKRVTILEAAYIHNYDVELLKTSRAMPETCRGF
jgi:hypothetical protein